MLLRKNHQKLATVTLSIFYYVYVNYVLHIYNFLLVFDLDFKQA